MTARLAAALLFALAGCGHGDHSGVLPRGLTLVSAGFAFPPGCGGTAAAGKLYGGHTVEPYLAEQGLSVPASVDSVRPVPVERE